MSADTITENDVIDVEIAAALAIVRCAGCDDPGEAIDMVEQPGAGEWMCWMCVGRNRKEWSDRTLARRGYRFE